MQTGDLELNRNHRLATLVFLLVWAHLGCATYPKYLPRPRDVNILRNSAFLTTTNPGIPDWWSNAQGAKTRADWPACWTPDEDVAVKGTRSMRLHNPTDGLDNRIQSYGYPAKVGEQYALSVYLKSDRDEVRVSAVCSYIGSKQFKVGREWKRYSFTGRVEKPKDGRSPRLWFTIVFRAKGTLWVNAPQIEVGEAPTAYAPSSKDFEPLGPAGGKDVRKRKLPWAPIPSVTCPETKTPPKIDGVLADECWKNAGRAGGFILYDRSEKAVAQTEALVTRDEQNFYLAARCFDSSLEGLKASGKGHDANVFSDDEIEIFLSPFADGEDYFQFAVNCAGARFDGFRMDASWNGEWQVKTGREAGAWTAEFAIPFYNLNLNRRVGRTWRLNICRHRCGPPEEYSSWSRTFLRFHEPRRFGRMSGINPSALRRYFLKVESVSVGRDGNGTIQMRSENADPVAAKVLVRVSFPGREKQARESSLELLPGQVNELIVAGIEVPADAERCDVEVDVFDGQRGQKLHRAVFRGVEVHGVTPALTVRCKLDRSFYTAEKEATAAFELRSGTIGAGTAVRAIVSVGSEDGTILSAKTVEARAGREGETICVAVPLDIADLPIGRYRVRFEVQDESGGVLASETRVLEKLESRPNEVKIDRLARCLLVGGKPFVPYAMGLSFENTDALRDIASHGFNSVVPTFRVGHLEDAKVKEAMDLADSLGLKVIFWTTFKKDMNYHEMKKGVLHWVEMFREHPALLAWKFVDEPEGWWKNTGGTEEDILDLYRAVHEADPYHPAFKNHWGWKRGYGSYGGLDATDIYSVDRYPIGRTPDAMPVMARLVDDINYDASRDGKPICIWLQMYGSYDSPREPTPAEQRCQTYITLIHGARMLFYFIYKPMSPDLWESMIPLGNEVRTITPILCSPPAGRKVSSDHEAVHTLFCEKEGRRFILAVNISGERVKAILDLSGAGLPAAGKARVMFEDREVTWRNGKLEDAFGPLERHVYGIAE